MPKYDFYHPSEPSFAEIRSRASSDISLSNQNRSEIIIAIDGIIDLAKQTYPRFVDFKPDEMPFIYTTVEGMITRIREALKPGAMIDLSPIVVGCRAALDHFDLRHPAQAPDLSQFAAWLASHAAKPYMARDMRRLWFMVSNHNLGERDISDEFMAVLLMALEADPAVQHPLKVWLAIVRGWNNSLTVPGWPQTRLTVPRTRKVWGTHWSKLLQLKGNAQEILARPKVLLGRIFRERAPRARRITTADWRLELVRLAASELICEGGVEPDDITSCRILLLPENAALICHRSIVRAGGRVTGGVKNIIETLKILADAEGVLAPAKREETLKILASYGPSARAYRKRNVSKTEQTFNAVNDNDVIETIAARSAEVFEWAQQQRVTRSVARVAKCAVIVLVGLEAPMTSLVWRSSRLEYFTRVEVDGVDQLLIEVPPGVASNGLKLNYLLTEPTSTRVDAYNRRFRPHLVIGESDYWIPGMNGQRMTSAAFSKQLKTFLGEKLGVSVSAAPSLLRRLIKEEILDADGGAVEVVRQTLGLKGTETTMAIAKQKASATGNTAMADLVTTGKLSQSRSKIVRR